MLRFVLRRLIITVPMVFVVVSLTWGLIRLAPGTFYSQERPIPAAVSAPAARRADSWISGQDRRTGVRGSPVVMP